VNDYLETLESQIAAYRREEALSFRIGVLALLLIAGLLCLVPLQAEFGHDDSRPKELR
jgi:hypothetical protein